MNYDRLVVYYCVQIATDYPVGGQKDLRRTAIDGGFPAEIWEEMRIEGDQGEKGCR